MQLIQKKPFSQNGFYSRSFRQISGEGLENLRI